MPADGVGLGCFCCFLFVLDGFEGYEENICFAESRVHVVGTNDHEGKNAFHVPKNGKEVCKNAKDVPKDGKDVPKNAKDVCKDGKDVCEEGINVVWDAFLVGFVVYWIVNTDIVYLHSVF